MSSATVIGSTRRIAGAALVSDILFLYHEVKLFDPRLPMTIAEFPSAQAVETAFYAAFENADYAAMMAVWSPDADIECIHPLGERLMGPEAVGNSWRRLLSGGKRMQFRLAHTKRFQTDRLAIHILYENITIADTQQPPVIATNVYRFNGRGWHMILHHASPATDIGKAAGIENTVTSAPVVH
jgi:ketosteroid isomerase-like protein